VTITLLKGPAPEPSPTVSVARVPALYEKEADLNGAGQLERARVESPDLDNLAENAEQKAGLHIVPADPYPKIRLIFATASDNFADFQFDGHTCALSGN